MLYPTAFFITFRFLVLFDNYNVTKLTIFDKDRI